MEEFYVIRKKPINLTDDTILKHLLSLGLLACKLEDLFSEEKIKSPIYEKMELETKKEFYKIVDEYYHEYKSGFIIGLLEELFYNGFNDFAYDMLKQEKRYKLNKIELNELIEELFKKNKINEIDIICKIVYDKTPDKHYAKFVIKFFKNKNYKKAILFFKELGYKEQFDVANKLINDNIIDFKNDNHSKIKIKEVLKIALTKTDLVHNYKNIINIAKLYDKIGNKSKSINVLCDLHNKYSASDENFSKSNEFVLDLFKIEEIIKELSKIDKNSVYNLLKKNINKFAELYNIHNVDDFQKIKKYLLIYYECGLSHKLIEEQKNELVKVLIKIDPIIKIIENSYYQSIFSLNDFTNTNEIENNIESLLKISNSLCMVFEKSGSYTEWVSYYILCNLKYKGNSKKIIEELSKNFDIEQIKNLIKTIVNIDAIEDKHNKSKCMKEISEMSAIISAIKKNDVNAIDYRNSKFEKKYGIGIDDVLIIAKFLKLDEYELDLLRTDKFKIYVDNLKKLKEINSKNLDDILNDKLDLNTYKYKSIIFEEYDIHPYNLYNLDRNNLEMIKKKVSSNKTPSSFHLNIKKLNQNELELLKIIIVTFWEKLENIIKKHQKITFEFLFYSNYYTLENIYELYLYLKHTENKLFQKIEFLKESKDNIGLLETRIKTLFKNINENEKLNCNKLDCNINIFGYKEFHEQKEIFPYTLSLNECILYHTIYKYFDSDCNSNILNKIKTDDFDATVFIKNVKEYKYDKIGKFNILSKNKDIENVFSKFMQDKENEENNDFTNIAIIFSTKIEDNKKLYYIRRGVIYYDVKNYIQFKKEIINIKKSIDSYIMENVGIKLMYIFVDNNKIRGDVSEIIEKCNINLKNLWGTHKDMTEKLIKLLIENEKIEDAKIIVDVICKRFNGDSLLYAPILKYYLKNNKIYEYNIILNQLLLNKDEIKKHIAKDYARYIYESKLKYELIRINKNQLLAVNSL